MKGSRRILSGALSNWLRFGVTAAVSFVLVPLMARGFGSERYGLWAMASSILGLLQALDAGFGAGTVKWTAETRSAGNSARRDQLLSTALAVHTIAAVVGSLIVGVLAVVFPRVAGADAALADESRAILLFIGLRVTLVGIPSGFLRGVLFGSDRLLFLNLVQTAAALAYGGVAYGLLAAGAGPVALSLAGLAVATVELLVLTIAVVVTGRRMAPRLRLSVRLLSRATFREALSFSGASFAIQVAGAVLMQSDILLLRLFVPLSVVAGYGVAMRAAEYAFILVKQAVNALTPPIARLDPVADPEKARFFLTNASKYAGGLASVFAVAAWVLGDAFLTAWAGVEYARFAPVLGILVAAFVILAVQMPCAAFLALKGDHRWASRAMLVSAALNLAVSLVLAVFLREVGVALGTLVAAAVVDGVVVPLHAYKRVGIRAAELIRRVWAKLVLPAAAETAVLLAARHLFPEPGLGALLMFGVAGAAVFAGVFAGLSMDAGERRLFAGGRRFGRGQGKAT